MSYPEVLLWQRLRRMPMGIKWRRQHPVRSNYVVDFFCAAAKLVVEIDGEVHSMAGAPERDALRDEYLRSLGLRVVRVPAVDVLRHADGAAEAIVSLASTPLHHPAVPDGPPPQQAGEDQR